MPAPVATTRGTPSGKLLRDGYRVLITFATAPTLKLYEKTVQPGAIDNGSPIDQTTQWNNDWLTKWPQALNELTDGQMTCGYDPEFYDEAHLHCGVRDTITYTFPDGTTMAVFGYMKSFAPASMQRGTMPEATVTIVHTNLDAAGAEFGPVIVEVVGT